ETQPLRPKSAHRRPLVRPRKSRIRVRAPSRARTHRDSVLVRLPRAPDQNALRRAAYLSSEAVSRPDVVPRSFVLLLKFAPRRERLGAIQIILLRHADEVAGKHIQI